MNVDDDGVVNYAPFVRSPYNYSMEAASDASGLRCLDSSRAIQSARDECDINTIVRNFGLTGQLPDEVRVPMSGDFSDVLDYQTALNAVIAADGAFMELPAAIRARFDNNPQKLMEFIADRGNLDEARKLGLLKPAQAEPEPLRVKVVPDPALKDSST